MNTGSTLQISSTSSNNTELLGKLIGANLRGGEVIVLVSDLGGGKTTFTRGLAAGAHSSDDVASPTFTLSRVYITDKFAIHHFDFYRLSDPGIMKHELAELIGDNNVVIVIEWGDIVADVLPKDKIKIVFNRAESEDERLIDITVNSEREYVIKGLK